MNIEKHIETHTMEDQLWKTPMKESLLAIDTFIGKEYLSRLDRQIAIPLSDDNKVFDNLRLFLVSKIVYNKEENINDKLISIYSAIQSIDSSVIMLICSNGIEVSFYLGIRSTENNQDYVASEILKNSFQGNFPGSELKNLTKSEIEILFSGIVDSSVWSNKKLASVAVSPSARDDDKDNFVQGIEKFIDTMSGLKYSAFVIARPLTSTELNLRKKGLEELYASLSPYAKSSLAYGENYSKAVTQGIADSFSRSINDSIASSVGSNITDNYSSSKGDSMSYGLFHNRNASENETRGTSYGKSKTLTETYGQTDTEGRTENYSESETSGTTSTVTLNLENKTIGSLMRKIEIQLDRIENCESFGVWECASYFISDDIETAVIAASTYKALMLGDDTHIEKTHVNIWENPGDIMDYIKYCQHPRFLIDVNGCDKQIICPTNIVSGKELPFLMGIPRKSVDGLTVNTIAEFGRNIISHITQNKSRTIKIGSIQHMGMVELNRNVELNLDSFTSHCFVTGSTGSGKSNTIYCLLSKFIENNVPFLIVEPAKGEYKTAFGSLPGINIFTTNPYIARMLKINPFRFNPNIHILEHLDRLIEIFNVCWEMYAAMPAILKSAIEQIYIDADWDLYNSVYVGEGKPRYPTFSDLVNVLPQIIDSSNYSSDAKGDYKGALVTRVQSLTNGIYGQIFCDSYDIADETLFDENTIVDLSRVGSSETKSLIMGILVLKLSEYRMSSAKEANAGLKHITVLEEAHNLLKNTNISTGGNSIVAKSVEMISNSIAEVRTYGEGFIIVDQSPTAVDISAIKNTNTKILMRLPEATDCKITGQSVALNESQIAEMSKLGTGVAIVMQNDWFEAILARIDKASCTYEKKIEVSSFKEIKELKSVVLTKMLSQYFEDRRLDKDCLIKLIEEHSSNEYVKMDMKTCVNSAPEEFNMRSDRIAFWNLLAGLSGAISIFSRLDKYLVIDNKTGDIDAELCIKWQQELLKGIANYTGISDDIALRRLGKLLTRLASVSRSDYYKYQKVYNVLYVKP